MFLRNIYTTDRRYDTVYLIVIYELDKFGLRRLILRKKSDFHVEFNHSGLLISGFKKITKFYNVNSEVEEYPNSRFDKDIPDQRYTLNPNI